jgi:WhiB family redox-sensing transcriptional regulator
MALGTGTLKRHHSGLAHSHVRTNVPALACVDAGLTADEWTTVRGRPVLCRQTGCGEPAVDERQLCPGHGWSQPSVPADIRRRIRARSRMKHDLPVAAKVTLGSDPWRERAACRDALGGNFFPDLYHYRGGSEIAAAKAICATCPVRKHCLSAGLNEAFGIWGGLTTEERRQLPSPRTQLVD